MAVHLQNEIEKLKKKIILYGGMIEKNLGNAIRSIQAKDAELARQVLERTTWPTSGRSTPRRNA